MADRSETAIVALVLLAAALVMAAPLLGRAGLAGAANAAMLVAAGSGVLAFGAAGWTTLRASRAGRGEREERR